MWQIRRVSANWGSLEWHSWHRNRIFASFVLVLTGSQWACGGSAESSDAGSGGSGTASTSGGAGAGAASGSGVGGGSADGASNTNTSTSTSTSGAVGTSSTGAGGAASGSPSVTSTSSGCCNGLPTCPQGWTDVPLEGCPDGVECMTVELCCDSVTCMPESDVICDAVPICDAGDIQVTECTADGSCYTQSLCGSTITCQDAECFPDREPNKSYVALGTFCSLIEFDCHEGTTLFYDECGCGCEQDESCPESVDCEPGGELDPLCTDLTTCPLTERAE